MIILFREHYKASPQGGENRPEKMVCQQKKRPQGGAFSGLKSGLYELGIIHHTEVAEKAFFHHLHLDGLDHFSDLVDCTLLHQFFTVNGDPLAHINKKILKIGRSFRFSADTLYRTPLVLRCFLALKTIHCSASFIDFLNS
jgi:hypothetical protein